MPIFSAYGKEIKVPIDSAEFWETQFGWPKKPEVDRKIPDYLNDDTLIEQGWGIICGACVEIFQVPEGTFNEGDVVDTYFLPQLGAGRYIFRGYPGLSPIEQHRKWVELFGETNVAYDLIQGTRVRILGATTDNILMSEELDAIRNLRVRRKR